MMTKAEALLALDEGHCIRWRSWWWKRWVKRAVPGYPALQDEKGLIYNERHVLTEPDGYEIYREDEHGLEN